jgi:short-subunit dehydrogenase
VARAYAHDARDYDATPALYEQIRADLHGAPLTLLVYAAGALASAGPDGWPFEAEREMIETNLIGAMRWLALGAETFAQQGHGTLVGVSSVAGDRGRAGNGAYMASKAGLSTYLESLRYKLARRGVRVVTIKPGFVATAMIAGTKPPRPLVISPERAAQRIAAVCECGPEVVYVPARWGLIMAIVRALPSSAMKRLKF